MYQTVTTPGTPDSAGILIGAAGNAANDKRNKTIMNCFRDRTPSYARTNSRGGIIRYENRLNAADKPDAFIFLKEPTMRSRPNKLALLKSTSTRDLSRLLEEKGGGGFGGIGTTSSNSSSDLSNNGGYCDRNCVKRMQELEKRLMLLEKEFNDQRNYTKELERKVIELTKKVDELNEIKQVEKRKKSSSFRKKQTAGQSTVQPSKLVAWMNLSNLWKHRPSIETLKEQNIYNGKKDKMNS